MQPTLTCAILAGGAGRRLGGRDKGLEPLLGRPLIAWVLDAVRHCELASDAEAAKILLVANRNLDQYRRFAATVSDHDAGYPGPLAGIAAALAACATPFLLTLPIDCPAPPMQLARRLGAGLGSNGAAVAHDGERRQPLFALYRRELADSAAGALRAGFGAWRWQDSIGAIEVDFADCRTQFANLNTPQHFLAWAAAHDADGETAQHA